LNIDKLHINAVPAPGYEALFRRTAGWVGADGDYSIPLSKDRVLWLFSDTFVGKVEERHRKDCVMINNSAAIQRLDQDARVEFYYGVNADGSPKSLITPDSGEGYFWLFHGALVGENLYLFLMRIVNTGGNSAFAFRGTGVSLGHVANPHDPPNKWKMTQQNLGCCKYTKNGDISFGSALLKDGSYIYIYGFDSTHTDPTGSRGNAMIAARAPKNQLGDPKTWRFLSGGKWIEDSARCDPLCYGIATEFSVSYLPAIGKYVCVYISGGIFGQIAVRLSPKPEGPWSDPTIVYDCPDKHWHEKTFSYAAKAHPELSLTPNELIVTYATNSMTFSDLIEDARLYWPRFVRLVFEKIRQ